MIKTTRQMILELKADTNFSMELGTLDSNIENLFVSRLDNAHDIVTDELLQQDPLMLSTYYDLTLDGSERYYLPDLIKYDYEIITMVEDITAGADSPVRTVYTIWGDRLDYKENWIYNSYHAWSIRDNNIEFPGTPSSGTIRIWYTRRPTGFFYCTAATGSTTTAILPVSMTAGQLVLEDDYYIGMKVATNNQVTRITDYVASTRTLTFDAQTTAITSSTVVDLISPLPERYQQRIVDLAVQRMLIGNQQDDSLIARYTEKTGNLMKNRISRKTAQAPKGIRKAN